MHQAGQRRVSAVAFVAACVLVLQSFLAGWAASASAATPMLDTFGNPLCAADIGHGDAPPSGDHSKPPDCCTFGCSMASPLLAENPAGGAWLLRPLSSASIDFSPPGTFHVRGPDYDPGNPRAPPVTA